jgi:hypothetical protein
MSTSELRQRDEYIEDAFGIKKKSTRLVALEKQLGLTIKYDPSSLDSPLYGVEVLFAVGDGAKVHSPHHSENAVKWNEFKDQASIARFTNESDFAGLYGGLDSPRYIYTSPTSEDPPSEYRLYKPFLHNNKWIRRFYAKLPEEVLIFDSIDDDDFPVKVQHVICRLSKQDLKPYTQSEKDAEPGVINELCLYMGQKVRVAKNSGGDTTSYLLLDHPKIDTINVEPYFRIVFDNIKISEIPENGLDFIFDIELHVAELQDDEDPDDEPDIVWPHGNIVVRFNNGHVILNESAVPEIVLPIPDSPPLPPPYEHISGDITVADSVGAIAVDESEVPHIELPIPPYIHAIGVITIRDSIGSVAIDESEVPTIEIPVPPYIHATGDITIFDEIGSIAMGESDVPHIEIPVPPYIHVVGDVTIFDSMGSIAILETMVPKIELPVPPYIHATGDITIFDEIGSIAMGESDVPPIELPNAGITRDNRILGKQIYHEVPLAA